MTSVTGFSIGIVGAGLSGLVAAEQLASSGHRVLVTERGSSPGGRLATRRIGAAFVDHGAQFFTVRSDRFRTDVDAWIEAGVVDEWCQGFDKVDGFPRYRADGGMSALARHLAERAVRAGATVATKVRTTAVIRGAVDWTLTHDHWVREPDEVDAVLLTAPMPESLALLAAGGVKPADPALADITYHRCLALLATVDPAATFTLPEAGATQQPADPAFSFIADNHRKGISPVPALTFHTAHALSAELWDASDKDVTARLVPSAAAAVGLEPSDFVDVQLKKWRFTGPVIPWPDRYAVAAGQPRPVLLAGDAFGGPKVEGAFLSGVAAATAITEFLTESPR
ncbi:MAG: FAD-dependent oxidoreductase [Actinomycetota bacterium]|nr:FAD-dependent oxidoreductase [Actinomycetota bacterium]